MINGNNSALLLKKLMPIGPFALQDVGLFVPEEDLTAYELGHIFNILVTLFLPKPENIVFNIKAYIFDHKLERHFKQNDEYILMLKNTQAAQKATTEALAKNEEKSQHN